MTGEWRERGQSAANGSGNKTASAWFHA